MPLLELETRALQLAPKSINDAERSAEIVISTGAGVLREDMDGRFLEILDLAGVDASRSNIPLLDSHRQDSLERVLGRVVEVRREGGMLVAKVRFAKTPSGEIAFQAVKDGDFSSASVGYAITNYEDRLDRQTGERVRMILGWTLHEVSLVPVAADTGASIRSMTMPETATTSAAPAPKKKVPAGTGAAVQTRAETNKEIRALAETFGLGAEFANSHIDGETEIDEVRAAALATLQTRATRTPTIAVTAVHDASPEETATRMGEAVFARSVPGHKVSDPARPYMNMTTLDMARSCLQVRGISTIGLSPADTITRALHTTSDFPAIFADTANRSLRRAYDAAPQVLKRLARQTTARDFRAKSGIQLGEAPTLEKVNEAGEYKYGTLAEASESYAIDTFGKIVSLSRKAIINDDIGAFVDLSGKLGMAAAEFEAQFLVNLLASGAGLGPTMADGDTLFHADHGNKSVSGAALDATTLGAARLAMRRQTGLSGKPINVTPKFVLVPPELETKGEQILAAIQPAKAEDVNPFGGKMELLVEARLASATRWYVVADPAQIDGLEYAYLQGEEGPQIETRAGFEVDGLEVKVRLDFGAAFMDWRGWYTNAGA
jgi:HK97 family phage prohead protease